MTRQEVLDPPIESTADRTNPNKQKRPRKLMAALIGTVCLLSAAEIATLIISSHKTKALQQEVKQAKIDGLENTLVAEGISVDHMSFKSLAHSTEAIYADKAEGKECKLGFTVYYQHNGDPAYPGLEYTTTDKKTDPITGIVLSVTEGKQFIYSTETENAFFAGMNSICNVEGS